LGRLRLRESYIVPGQPGQIVHLDIKPQSQFKKKKEYNRTYIIRLWIKCFISKTLKIDRQKKKSPLNMYWLI
jgi:hypothetical protein